METLTQQQFKTSRLIDNLIENNLPETLKQIRETLVDYTVHLYPTDENKEMIERIDKYLNNTERETLSPGNFKSNMEELEVKSDKAYKKMMIANYLGLTLSIITLVGLIIIFYQSYLNN